MQLYFIRHGQSQNNDLHTRTGSSEGRSEDPGLTDAGRRQAKVLARFLGQAGPPELAQSDNSHNVAGFGITHLYCSLMVRAIDTGLVVAKALGLSLMAWEDLHEIGGIFRFTKDDGPTGLPGKPRAYFEAHYPQLALPDSVGPEGWWNRPFEDHEERTLRAQRFLDELLARHGGTDDRVALISHGGFCNYLLTVILDCPRTKERRYKHWFILNNAAITRIDFQIDRTVLVYANRTDFMPDEWIT